ncbi:MAG: STAS/SEC14 domain-containing protein [Chloroflexota bacterium]
MAYRVFWQDPDHVLYLELEGNLSLNDFAQINRTIIDLLGNEGTNRHVSLLVDITRPGNTPRDFERLKASQTYLLRRDLKFILVAGSDKFMRLMMLLTFNLCKPNLRFFDNIDQALKVAKW